MIEFLDAGVVASSSGSVMLEPTTAILTEGRVSVVGANGSGKTTLLRLLIGCHLLVAFHETGRHASGCLAVPESGTTDEVMDLVDLRLV